jgi:hypothetical protein
MHRLADTILDLLMLIENAEDIHIIESSIGLMIYMLQFKNLLKPKKVYFHVTARHDLWNNGNSIRCCTKDNYTENFFVRMMLNPKINDWIIIT